MKGDRHTASMALPFVAACLILVAAAPGASAQGSYDLSWYTVDGGGATFSAGGGYELGATIGQPDAGSHSGGTFDLAGGFWNGGLVPTVYPPGPLDVDMEILIVSDLNLNGPACRSLGILGIDPNGNPAGTLYAIQIGDAPDSGWLERVNSGPPLNRDDVFPTAEAPEWHTAIEWMGIRLRGLEPETVYTFHARAKLGTSESDLTEVGIYDTSKDCDVNRNGRATALDYAHIKQDILTGETIGVDQGWPCDPNDDGLVNVGDLNATRWRIFHP
jgi:hypothetical protein